jgi:hypothetical protein
MHIAWRSEASALRGIAALGLLFAASCAHSAEWSLRKQKMSNVCHVQKTTASPLGETLSEHPSRAAACREARRLHDPELSDSTKCWEYGQGTRDACRQDGVPLAGSIGADRRNAFTLRSVEQAKPSAQQGTVSPFIVGGAPADPKTFRSTLVFEPGCTATIVGSKAILTAAHCVSNGASGVVELDGKVYKAVCTHHPDYSTPTRCNSTPVPMTCTADISLCKSDSDLKASGLRYEVVETKREKLSVGQPIVLLGYGCTSAGGQDFGTLFVGSSKIGVLSSTNPKSFNDHFMQLNQLALTCNGDSGAGNFDRVDEKTRSLIGVTARGNATNLSLLVQTTDKRVQDFMRSWAAANATAICGVTPNALGCR